MHEPGRSAFRLLSNKGDEALLQEREAKRQKLKEEGAAAFIGASLSSTSSRDQPEEPVRPRVGHSKQQWS